MEQQTFSEMATSISPEAAFSALLQSHKAELETLGAAKDKVIAQEFRRGRDHERVSATARLENRPTRIWRNVGVSAALVVASLVIIFSCVDASENEARANELSHCTAGQMLPCMEAAHDANQSGDWERVKLLNTAYVIAAGHPLPSMVGDPVPVAPALPPKQAVLAPVVNGIAVEAVGGDGVKLTRGDETCVFSGALAKFSRQGQTVSVGSDGTATFDNGSLTATVDKDSDVDLAEDTDRSLHTSMKVVDGGGKEGSSVSIDPRGMPVRIGGVLLNTDKAAP